MGAKAFSGHRSLRKELGINILTGEACAFSMRLLCDLDEQGLDLLRDYYGLTYGSKFAERMNSLVDEGRPSVASTMIQRDAFPALIRFALFRQGYKYVYGAVDGWDYSYFNDSDIDEDNNLYLRMITEGKASWANAKLFVNPKSPAQPSVGSRNVHAATGRTL